MPQKEGGSTGYARTPEELEALFEDALIVGEQEALTELFGEGAVLVTGSEHPVHGPAEIAKLARETWQEDHPYMADPQYVLQARDIALVITEGGINVACRRDGTWRYAIAFHSVSGT